MIDGVSTSNWKPWMLTSKLLEHAKLHTMPRCTPYHAAHHAKLHTMPGMPHCTPWQEISNNSKHDNQRFLPIFTTWVSHSLEFFIEDEVLALIFGQQLDRIRKLCLYPGLQHWTPMHIGGLEWRWQVASGPEIAAQANTAKPNQSAVYRLKKMVPTNAFGPGEMAQKLRAHTALAEGLCPDPTLSCQAAHTS